MKTRKRGGWFAWLILLTALGITHTGFAQESTEGEGETTDASATTTPTATPAATPTAAKPDDKKKAATSIAQAQAAGLPTNVDRDWQISLSSTLGVGSGAFVEDANARRTRVRFGLDFGGSYTIPDTSLNISVSTGFTQWLSRGSTGDQQEPQLFRWSDSSISFFHPIYAFDFGLRFMGNLTFVIPTSTASLQSDLYTTINPTLIVLQRFGNLTFQYVLDYSHNFNKYTSTVYNPSEVDILSRNGGAEQLSDGLVASGGVLNEMTLFNSFGVNYSFFDNFLFSIRFGFADFWTYDNGTITEEDEFTSPYADSSRGHGQSSFGVLRFTYNPSNYLSAALSMSTQQPWKTSDNQGFRFPFFDFESPANNLTNFNLTVTAFY